MGYARLIYRFRYAVIAAWLVAAAAVTAFGAGGVPGSGNGLGGLIGDDNSAVAAEIRSFQLFGFPLLSRVAVVQRDPDGLSVEAQAKAVLRAVSVNQGEGDVRLVLGALPVPNTLGIVPKAAETETGVITYLFLPPGAGFADQRGAAEDYAERYLSAPDDALVGVTGSIPARAAQAEVIEGSLPFVETATLAAILLLVALAFRSPIAAVTTLGVAGLSTVVTVSTVGRLAEAFGLSVPDEVRPLLVALLLGVVTDYCVFFLAGLRQELEQGQPSRTASLLATARTGPIVLVAGITVGAGTGSLLVARSGLFRGLGPGLALTVLMALAVTVTLVPAVLAVLGRFTLWPSAPRRSAGPARVRLGDRVVRVLTTRRSAGIVMAATVAALLLACLPLRHLDLGVSFIASLPSESRVSVAAQEARTAFVPGIVAPTEVLVEGEGVGRDPAQLAAFGNNLRRQPGVASVLGPGTLPLADDFDVFQAKSGNAARYLLFTDARPLSAPAIDTVTGLRERLPTLLQASGLPPATASLAGDTALSELIVRATQADLLRLAVAALLANLVMLLLFTRALWTSLVLLASSVLALGAALGLTVLLFQDVLGGTGLTFYVPFAAAVLLVSLGSDYNIYAVGKVWEAARSRSLIEALRAAVPASSRAITAAALALAASFGMLALVPLRPFRELGFAMALGVMIDAVVVRSLLLPTLLTLLGRHASQGVHRAERERAERPQDTPSVPA